MASSSSLPANEEDTTTEVVAPPSLLLSFKSHSHVFNTTMAFVCSMTFKCAVDLGIPDALQRKGGFPVTLKELAAELAIPPARTQCLSRLMRVLEHQGYFARRAITGGCSDEGYVLTPASACLIGRRNPPLATALIPSMMTPYLGLSSWFQGDVSPQQQQSRTPFHAASGGSFWEFAGRNPEVNEAFNAAISHDADLIASDVVAKCGHVLGGARSLVDVGGGNGALARAISEAFPHLDCTVLELPHVVAEHLTRPTTERVAYVAGDMFDYIPQADVLLLKYILHCYEDEECIKILRQCKKAVAAKAQGGKVIVVEVVMELAGAGGGGASEMVVQNQLIMDMVMMTLTGGKERTEKEWAHIFVEAGFNGGYKMTPILDHFLCLIEL